MNLLHLKYVIEVANAGSISKAANNLFMNQPHLSKIIKDLEENLNIVIFERTSKGVFVTKKGSEFIDRAKSIILQVEQLEAKYKDDDKSLHLDICIPRVSYIKESFINYLTRINFSDKNIKVNFYETNNLNTLNKVLEGDVNLGIIRFLETEADYFTNVLINKDLEYEKLLKFDYYLLASKNSSINYNETVSLKDLNNLTEIVYGDENNSLVTTKTRNDNKMIKIYQPGIQYDLLNRLEHTYMWSSTISSEILDKYALVLKKCDDYCVSGYDVLIKRKGYRMTKEDREFVEELHRNI